MDLLSLRRGIVGFARSFNHISRFVSVTVTRGGGLKVEAEVICPLNRRCAITLVKRDDSVCSPLLCLSAEKMAPLADPVSFCVICALS